MEGGKQPLAEVLEPAYYDDSSDMDDIVELRAVSKIELAMVPVDTGRIVVEGNHT